jgi:F0F1-type ATP synthase membrane subunit c/vacuolar-type H+-ATPase subunit K
MMNRPSIQPGADAGLEVRLRTMRILWAVFLVTIGLYALIPFFVLGSRSAAAEVGDDPTLLAAFAVLAFMAVAASFVLKRHFYGHAVERGEPARLQTGFILALVFCEFPALLGLVGLFVTLNRYAYALLALGALGLLLHFPRRDQLAAAYGEKQW